MPSPIGVDPQGNIKMSDGSIIIKGKPTPPRNFYSDSTKGLRFKSTPIESKDQKVIENTDPNKFKNGAWATNAPNIFIWDDGTAMEFVKDDTGGIQYQYIKDGKAGDFAPLGSSAGGPPKPGENYMMDGKEINPKSKMTNVISENLSFKNPEIKNFFANALSRGKWTGGNVFTWNDGKKIKFNPKGNAYQFFDGNKWSNKTMVEGSDAGFKKFYDTITRGENLPDPESMGPPIKKEPTPMADFPEKESPKKDIPTKEIPQSSSWYDLSQGINDVTNMAKKAYELPGKIVDIGKASYEAAKSLFSGL